MNLDDLIVNLEKDGDEFFHIHHKNCPNAPKDNFVKFEYFINKVIKMCIDKNLSTDDMKGILKVCPVCLQIDLN